jgi:hypothetical protein
MVGAGVRTVGLVGLTLVGGCIEGLTQVAGTGAVYTTRCSGDMIAEGSQYRVRCVPEGCAPGFEAGPISHVVVAIDPGTKMVGYAERVCLQDLSHASARFTPAPLEPAPPQAEAPTTAPAPQ